MHYTSGSTAGLKSPIAGDYNNDGLLDVAFYNCYTESIHILLGNTDIGEAFQTDMTLWLGNFDGFNSVVTLEDFGTYSFVITSGDFDGDNQLDIAFTAQNFDYVYIMIGNGEGTFRLSLQIFIGNNSDPKGISAVNLNDDGYLDIVVANYGDSNIGILLGNSNGTFSSMVRYYTGYASYPSSIVITDLNGDGFQDISVSNSMNRNIGIFLGNSDGTFQQQKTYFTGGDYYPYYIAVGDFNNDGYPDIVCSYNDATTLGVLFGLGNGSLGAVTKYSIRNPAPYARIAVGDVNNDGNADIIVAPVDDLFIAVLTGYGNGAFAWRIVYSTSIVGSYTWVDVADFNNDGCLDLFCSDDVGGNLFILFNTCQCLPSTTSQATNIITP